MRSGPDTPTPQFRENSHERRARSHFFALLEVDDPLGVGARPGRATSRAVVRLGGWPGRVAWAGGPAVGLAVGPGGRPGRVCPVARWSARVVGPVVGRQPGGPVVGRQPGGPVVGRQPGGPAVGRRSTRVVCPAVCQRPGDPGGAPGHPCVRACIGRLPFVTKVGRKDKRSVAER